ncbi:MAG TPA: S8 family serine peptidase, partial [Bacteroidales bacterium]|nr:S8 family serine peptidase [Bacteroidales bacterium]
MMKQFFITISFLLATTISIFGQTADNQSQSEVDHFLNWQNKSINTDDAFGVETEKTYNELLKDKKSTTVIVAVIDGGIDITHEDLKENIWINKDEIPDNGIDDDHNGYIDDINGWNYLGNANGENISYENLEITRIYREFKPKYENAKKRKLNGKDLENYELYKLAEKKYKKEYKMATRQATGFRKFTSKYNDTYHKISKILTDTLLTTEKLDSLKLANKKLKKDIKFIYPFVQYGFSMDMFKEFETEITKQLDYHLNLEFTPRDIIGDNQDDFNTVYGNNNVYGPHAFHGTHVSGIIAAIRNNDTGINGIAGDVKIMALKVVPDGDERDKDVAKAIRYAADNGARIINMSFGKE